MSIPLSAAVTIAHAGFGMSEVQSRRRKAPLVRACTRCREQALRVVRVPQLVMVSKCLECAGTKMLAYSAPEKTKPCKLTGMTARLEVIGGRMEAISGDY